MMKIDLERLCVSTLSLSNYREINNLGFTKDTLLIALNKISINKYMILNYIEMY